jgi:hypothetical protein
MKFSCVVVVCVFAGGGMAGAQTNPTPPSVTVPPLNIMLPNYNSVAAGETGSLEGGAFIVRANDSSSAFYNPAGLALAEQTSISGSAGVFQIDRVHPENLSNTGSSFQQIPSMFGLVIKDLFHSPQWAAGGSIVRVNAWHHSTAGDQTFTVGTSTERASITSSAELSGYMMNIGIGYSNMDKLRVGGSVDGQYTTTLRAQSFGDQFRNTTGLTTLLVGGNGWGSTAHLRMSLGAQYDITPTIHVGGVMRTPGIGVYSSGQYAQEGVSHAGAVTTTASFFDDSPSVEYKIPFEFKVGGAYGGKRGQIEVDLIAYQGAGAYPSLQSSNPLTVITDQGLGGAPTVQTLPLTSPIIDSTSVVNVVVGGRFNLSSNGVWRLHGGYGTDRSPVGPNDTNFTKVDLQNWTVGISGRASIILASLGLRVSTGTSDPITLRTLTNGQPLQTTLKATSVGLVYSVAVLF